MLLPALLFTSMAPGLTLDLADVALPEPLDGAAILDAGEYSWIIGFNADNLVVLDPTGALAERVAGGAADVAVADLDGDGVPEVVRCGPAGLGWSPWVGGLGAESSIDAESCAAVIAHDLDGVGVAAAAADVRVWWREAGGWSAPTALGLELAGDPLLATLPGALGVAVVGGASVWEYDLGSGLLERAAGGSVAGLAGLDDWAVTLSDLEVLQLLGGDPQELAWTPGRLAAADVDGDGLLEAIVLYPGVGVIEVFPGAGGDSDTAALSVPASRLAVGDLDGDGCAEILAIGAGETTLTLARASACAADQDEDGWAAADGDCDDADAAIFPGAAEACDGVDNDCDDLVDEAVTIWYPDADVDGFGDDSAPVLSCGEPEDGIWSEIGGDCDDSAGDVYPGAPELCDDVDNDCDGLAPTPTAIELEVAALTEGGHEYIRAQTVGCEDEGLAWAWTLVDDGGIAQCTFAEDEALCDFSDQGSLTLQVDTAWEKEVFTLTQTLNVSNVSPVLHGGDQLWRGPLNEGDAQLTLGEYIEGTFLASDPGDDTVTFSLSGAPDFAFVSADGFLSILPPEEGSWTFYLELTDEDGGRTVYPIQLEVDDPSNDWEANPDTGGGSPVVIFGCKGDDDDDYEEVEEEDEGGCGGSGGGALLLLVGIGLLALLIRA